MILTCPACSTRYLIDPALLGPDGREVRCAKCAHQWIGKPSLEEPPQPSPLELETGSAPEQTTEQEADQAPEQAAEQAAEQESVPGPDSEAAAGPTRFGPPAIARPPSRPNRVVAWAVLALLIGVFAGGLVARQEIVAVWPSTARLYERLGLGAPTYDTVLAVRNASSAYQQEDGKPVLVVQGEVVNISAILQTVPKLRASLRENGREVQASVFQAAQSRLLPGEMASFVTRFTDPSPSATELTITFTDEP